MARGGREGDWTGMDLLTPLSGQLCVQEKSQGSINKDSSENKTRQLLFLMSLDHFFWK